ncbi:AraC family transcriptional regulator [Paenibacillus sp. ClWae2A]|uniref:AraC family transcriptional regulator n=1 Tax=Paenibacillus sp. ClWae2A TaxID=3057177 RepID=UPI0028F6A58E|nr:AraC family transcriptional regulator [Paenibacillus sp. ClWae2A]MDT9720074.1 AraC family transcriptional regulator [Paenibacillus sp. ClWae2A]
MNIEEYGALWEHITIRLLDIRIITVNISEDPNTWILPSNAFLLITNGKGKIWLGQAMHQIKGTYILHASKGTRLDCLAKKSMEIHVLSYSSPESEKLNTERSQTYNGVESLQVSFGFEPAYPLPFIEIMQLIYRQWNELQSAGRIQTKALFYQWLAEMLKQMLEQRKNRTKLDRVDQAVHYLKRHYAEPLKMEQVADMLECSPRYLNQLFQLQLNTSPSRVLSQIRMEQAMKLLVSTKGTLQEIAERVGYENGYTLSRYFKKHYGVSPEFYRKRRESIIQDIAPNTFQPNTLLKSHYPEWSERAVPILEVDQIRPAQDSVNLKGVQVRKSSEPAIPRARTRILATSMGEIMIPNKPSRVVVDWNLGEVLALGVTPLGAPHSLIESNQMLEPYIYDQVQDIGNHNFISLEKVLELEPDLIITWNPAAYASYARIAPTVVYGGNGYASVAEEIREMGRILNRHTEAETWIKEYGRRVHTLQQTITGKVSAEKTFTVIDPNWGEHITLVGNTGTRGGKAAYGLLNLKPAGKVRQELLEPGLEYLDIARSAVGGYLEDYLLVLDNGPRYGFDDQALGKPWEKSIETDHCRVISLDWNRYFLSDPLSAVLQAEEMAARIMGH